MLPQLAAADVVSSQTVSEHADKFWKMDGPYGSDSHHVLHELSCGSPQGCGRSPGRPGSK